MQYASNNTEKLLFNLAVFIKKGWLIYKKNKILLFIYDKLSHAIMQLKESQAEIFLLTVYTVQKNVDNLHSKSQTIITFCFNINKLWNLIPIIREYKMERDKIIC